MLVLGVLLVLLLRQVRLHLRVLAVLEVQVVLPLCLGVLLVLV
jgi:hypothetical protein